MSPQEFRAFLEQTGLFKSHQNPELRYQIAVLRHSSPVLEKVYCNWRNEELGIEDFYEELILKEAGELQIQYAPPVPDQPLNPPGC